MIESRNLLLIMRHAESNPPDSITSDRNRDLSIVGKTQPGLIASELRNLHISIHQALVSPANRTAQTFMLLKNSMPKPQPEAIFCPELYNATLEDILEFLPDHICEKGCVLVLGHCPGVNQLAEHLTGQSHSFAPAELAILAAKEKDLVQSLLAPKRFDLVQIVRPY